MIPKHVVSILGNFNTWGWVYDVVRPLLSQVYGLPTLIVFNDGKEVPGSKNEGAIGKTQLAEYLKKYVTAPVSAS